MVVDSVKRWLTKASWTAPQKHVSVVDIIAIWRLQDRGIAVKNNMERTRKLDARLKSRGEG